MPNPNKGTVLKKVSQKARDRCFVKAGCPNGGPDNTPANATKGTIVAVQQFSGQTFYHVLIDNLGPPAFWYAADCLIVKQGALPALRAGNQAQVVVTKGNYTAAFKLDQVAVDSYVDEGFQVVLDDSVNTPS